MRLTEEQRHALSMLVVVTGHLNELMSENDEFNNWFSTLGVYERSADEVQASVLVALEEDNERKRSE
ncbi:hypothetical protein D3C75_232770 [compost metagenome]